MPLRVAGQRQQAPVVLQQHRALDCGLPDDDTGRRIVRRHLARSRVSGARPVGQREDTGHRPVEVDVADLVALYGLQQPGTTLPRWTGHLQIEPRLQRFCCAVGAEPVAHDETVEAPLVAQHMGQ